MAANSAKHPETGQPETLWDSAHDYLRVIRNDLETEAQVGLHPWEQHPERPTRLLVTVEMFAHVGPPSEPGGTPAEKPVIDYDTVRRAVRGWPSRPHTPLLE